MPITAPTDVAGCVVWLAADRDGAADGDPIGSPSNGGSGGAWVAFGAARPTYRAGATPAGKPAFRFDGAGDLLYGPSLTGLTSGGTIFVVIRVVADAPSLETRTGLWDLSSTAGTTGGANHYPWTDGVIYDSAGATTRKTVGNPTPTLAAWRVYEVQSAPGSWRAWLDGALLFSTASNSVGWAGSPSLGRSTDGTRVYSLDGDVAAFVLYSGALTDPQRADVRQYLTARYLTPTTPLITDWW